jgi:hypothetical protein
MDAELAVDLPQVELDRLGRQEQVGGDIAVGRAALDGLGHPPFLRGERSLVRRLPAARSGRAQLGFGLAGPGVGVQLLEGVQRGPQVHAGRRAPAGPVQAAAEREQGACPFERHGPPVVERECAGEGLVEVVVEQAAAAGRRRTGHRAGGRGGLVLEAD